MNNASQYRALASLCRQQAAHEPHLSWQLLGQAERWEHLAADAIAGHKACNRNDPGNRANSGTASGENASRWTKVAAA